MHFTLYTADCRENARNIRYPNPAAITTAADLKKATAYDHVCAQYADGIRKEANFQFSDVLPMDCDNDHSDNPNDWLTPETLAQRLPDVAFAATYSRHHMQAKGKYSARPPVSRLLPNSPLHGCSHAQGDEALHSQSPAVLRRERPGRRTVSLWGFGGSLLAGGQPPLHEVPGAIHRLQSPTQRHRTTADLEECGAVWNANCKAERLYRTRALRAAVSVPPRGLLRPRTSKDFCKAGERRTCLHRCNGILMLSGKSLGRIQTAGG